MNDPEEINEIFDGISYEKGSTVIMMLIKYIGMEQFQKGIHHYLTKHMYQNTVTNNLWDAMEVGSTDKVKEFMNL